MEQDAQLYEQVADIILDTSLECRSGESLAVIHDRSEVADRLVEAVVRSARDRRLSIRVQEVKQPAFPGEDVSVEAEAAMVAANATFICTQVSLTYCQAVKHARARGGRVLLNIRPTVAMLQRIAGCDYVTMRQHAERVRKVLAGARQLELTSGDGVQLRLPLAPGRTGFLVDGFVEPGGIDWLPAGSVHIAPLEGVAQGQVVINGSLVPLGLLADPIRFSVFAGFVTQIDGGVQARQYAEFMQGFRDPNVFNVGELGLGVNPQGTLVGVAVEDERIAGGVTLGIGQNLVHGGVVKAPTHTDAIVLGASLTADGRQLLEQGRLVI